MTKDFRIKVGVRNNALLECIERAGHQMGPTFCTAAGVNYNRIGAFVAMRLSPVKDGSWRPEVLKLADYLGVAPEEMFRTVHIEPLAKNTAERKADAQEVFDLLNAPDEDDLVKLVEKRELSDTVDSVLGTLTEREQEVITRHTMGGETLADLGRSFGVGQERIRQIEAKALRKLRKPDRSDKLREFAGDRP